MKRIALYLGIAAALVTSCSIEVGNFDTPQQDDVVFYASFEQPAEGTRVYVNEDLNLRWTTDDRVSIFNKITYNQQYQFLGQTGDNAGGFNKVDAAEFVTGNPISHIVSVYPYQEGTKISESEVISLTLPAEQHYAENTFGLGANTMVSVSEDNVLQYKNVGGYLRISLYGDGVSVSSITLKGNNGEKLAGKASVTMPQDGVPIAVFADDATDRITLVCDNPVTLGSTEDESKDFWFVVPPVTFEAGFTVTVKTQSGPAVKSTTNPLVLERNKLSKMAPFEVDYSQSNNVIFYTSSEGNIITPYKTDVFGASIVSNEYVDGMGILVFDGEVTGLGDWSFYLCRNLASISIPSSVSSIGDYAFCNCSGITGITIPESVISIGDCAFSNCSNLTGISIPGSVNSIGERAFYGCSSLCGVTISDGVTSIGGSAFEDCTSLDTITIPESIDSIGVGVFVGCSSLLSFSGKYASLDGLYLIVSNSVICVAPGAAVGDIAIPENVTSIGASAFYGCSNLTGITIPDSVISIGDSAFRGCSSLRNITIPDGVTSLSSCLFYGCSNLRSVSFPDGFTCIGRRAFKDCILLNTISIPNSVTSIEYQAFFHSGIVRITIPDSVTSLGIEVFLECYNLVSATLSSNLTSLPSGTFYYCSALSSITIPDGVTSVESQVFYDCRRLSTIVVPENVTSIGRHAFAFCSGLNSITILSETPPAGDSYMLYKTNNCPIYVPANSVESYKAAPSWRDYSGRIQAILE